VLSRIRQSSGAELAFAGTTDLTTCAGLSWERYRLYVAVQIAQARFLGCSMFRLFAGPRSEGISIGEIVERVHQLCLDLAPMTACVELHAGIESAPTVLEALISRTPVKIVVDFENVERAGLTTAVLLETVALDRVAYIHQRNLPGVWTEHPASLQEESRWRELAAGTAFLWEPKTVDDPGRIQELFREYRRSH
jgi:hypothetical protein